MTKAKASPTPVSAAGDPDPRATLADLENQLYGHVLDAIDFDKLYQLEHTLWGLLDRRGIDDVEGEMAKTLLVDAVSRAARDPASYHGVSPPPGITEDEERAAQFDPACPFCRMEAEQAAYAPDPATIAADRAEEASLDALYAEAARRWRAEHAEQLARGKRALFGKRGTTGHAHETPGATP